MQRDIITKSLVFVALLSQLVSIYLTTHYGTIPFYVPHIYTAFYGLEFLLFVYTKPYVWWMNTTSRQHASARILDGGNAPVS